MTAIYENMNSLYDKLKSFLENASFIEKIDTSMRKRIRILDLIKQGQTIDYRIYSVLRDKIIHQYMKYTDLMSNSLKNYRLYLTGDKMINRVNRKLDFINNNKTDIINIYSKCLIRELDSFSAEIFIKHIAPFIGSPENYIQTLLTKLKDPNYYKRIVALDLLTIIIGSYKIVSVKGMEGVGTNNTLFETHKNLIEYYNRIEIVINQLRENRELLMDNTYQQIKSYQIFYDIRDNPLNIIPTVLMTRDEIINMPDFRNYNKLFINRTVSSNFIGPLSKLFRPSNTPSIVSYNTQNFASIHYLTMYYNFQRFLYNWRRKYGHINQKVIQNITTYLSNLEHGIKLSNNFGVSSTTTNLVQTYEITDFINTEDLYFIEYTENTANTKFIAVFYYSDKYCQLLQNNSNSCLVFDSTDTSYDIMPIVDMYNYATLRPKEKRKKLNEFLEIIERESDRIKREREQAVTREPDPLITQFKRWENIGIKHLDNRADIRRFFGSYRNSPKYLIKLVHDQTGKIINPPIIVNLSSQSSENKICSFINLNYQKSLNFREYIIKGEDGMDVEKYKEQIFNDINDTIYNSDIVIINDVEINTVNDISENLFERVTENGVKRIFETTHFNWRTNRRNYCKNISMLDTLDTLAIHNSVILWQKRDLEYFEPEMRVVTIPHYISNAFTLNVNGKIIFNAVIYKNLNHYGSSYDILHLVNVPNLSVVNVVIYPGVQYEKVGNIEMKEMNGLKVFRNKN